MKRWFSASEARLNFLAGALILGLFLLPFLPNLAGFGFYKDDWHMIWAGHTRGPQAIISLFVVDRPFMGVVNAFTYALLGDSPLAWTLFALALRAAGSLAFGWLVNLAWPKLGRSLGLGGPLLPHLPRFPPAAQRGDVPEPLHHPRAGDPFHRAFVESRAVRSDRQRAGCSPSRRWSAAGPTC